MKVPDVVDLADSNPAAYPRKVEAPKIDDIQSRLINSLDFTNQQIIDFRTKSMPTLQDKQYQEMSAKLNLNEDDEE